MRYLQNQEFKDEIDTNIDTDQIVAEYKSWVQREVFLLLQKERKGKLSLFRKVHAAKRGDAYYVERTNRNFQDKTGHIPDIDYFSKRTRGIQKTDLIFVTGTYATKNQENWLNNGRHFQEFANRMRKTYGRIEFIRVWESHADGYPHWHAVIRLEKELNCRKIKRTWRIIGKEYKRIKAYWDKGLSDIIALNGTHEVIAYLSKYITKSWNGDDGKHVRTLAMLWYYQKRAFSISKRFFEDCRAPAGAALFSTLHNSYQEGRWIYLGVFRSEDCEDIMASTLDMELFALRRHRKKLKIGGYKLYFENGIPL